MYVCMYVYITYNLVCVCAYVIVQCTYIEVELPSKSSNALVLSQPASSWGAEMGANDQQVCIGCSHLHTSAPVTSGLTAHDLVRSVHCRSSVSRRLPPV